MSFRYLINLLSSSLSSPTIFSLSSFYLSQKKEKKNKKNKKERIFHSPSRFLRYALANKLYAVICTCICCTRCTRYLYRYIIDKRRSHKSMLQPAYHCPRYSAIGPAIDSFVCSFVCIHSFIHSVRHS